jgi:hypothetical protein
MMSIYEDDQFPPLSELDLDIPFQTDEQNRFASRWFAVGRTDGEHKYPRQVLVDPFDIYQEKYDTGYEQGVWNRLYIPGLEKSNM